MQYDEERIAHILRMNPGQGYVTQDGRRIYILLGNGELRYHSGINLHTMSPKQLNRYLHQIQMAA